MDIATHFHVTYIGKCTHKYIIVFVLFTTTYITPYMLVNSLKVRLRGVCVCVCVYCGKVMILRARSVYFDTETSSATRTQVQELDETDSDHII